MDYLVVYNHQQPFFEEAKIHDTIINLPISDWWHYLPNVYIIRTSHNEKTIADGIIARNPGLLFLVVKVDLTKTNGVLNRSAWDWINKKIQSLFKLKPAPNPPPLQINQLLNNRLPSKPGDVKFPSKLPPLPPFLHDR